MLTRVLIHYMKEACVCACVTTMDFTYPVAAPLESSRAHEPISHDNRSNNEHKSNKNTCRVPKKKYVFLPNRMVMLGMGERQELIYTCNGQS